MPDPTPADPPANDTGPTTVEAVLTGSDLDDLFRDLTACVELQHIAVKHEDSRARAEPMGLDLAQARAVLDQPQTLAVQLRYAFEGALWIDTLTRTPTGFHLRRLRHA